jgi:hypothetical protein
MISSMTIWYSEDYFRDINAPAVLIQVPSTFACAQRIHEIADAVGIPAFTADPTQYTSIDGGGHLDAISAHKWSTQFVDWLTQLPQSSRHSRAKKNSHA